MINIMRHVSKPIIPVETTINKVTELLIYLVTRPITIKLDIAQLNPLIRVIFNSLAFALNSQSNVVYEISMKVRAASVPLTAGETIQLAATEETFVQFKSLE